MSTISAYTGDGSTTQFDITFTYSDSSTVRASLDGVETEDFSFVNPSRIAFDTAPADGVEINIFRYTPVSTPVVEFADGAIIRGDDLNEAVAQPRNRVEEIESELTALETRAVKVPAGEDALIIPTAAERAAKFAIYDDDGNPSVADGAIAVAPLASNITTTNDGSVQTALDQRNPVIVDYSGATDAAALIQAKITLSYSDYNRTVKFRNGRYKVSTGITVGQGVMVEAEGSQGSHVDLGSSFQHDANGGFGFKFDATSGLRAGTGGGLKNWSLFKATGKSGGNAIDIEAQDDDHRPGEMVLSNILIGPNSGANWDRGLVIDGTAANTAGTRGVRHIHVFKLRAASSNVDNESIVLNQVTHFFGHGLAIDQGSGSGIPGMTLRGINDSIFIPSGDLAANLIIEADAGRDTDGSVIGTTTDATDNFHYTGKVGSFQNLDRYTTGTANLSHTVNSAQIIINKSKSLKVTSHLNPDFSVYRASTATNFVGDGTSVNLTFDTEERDMGNNLGGTGPWSSFTCYSAGTYEFILSVLLNNLSSDHNIGQLFLLVTQAAGGSRSYTASFNPYGNLTGANQSSHQMVRRIALEYGDVVTAKLLVSGSGGGTTKTIGLVGDSARQTHFSGYYLN